MCGVPIDFEGAGRSIFAEVTVAYTPISVRLWQVPHRN
jgi:hypothetical protein